MRIACSGLPINLSEYNTTPHNGDETRDHAMVYPFKISLPRYASWRACVRAILKQLKSCHICRAAADAFPISSLPKVHKLPNGKVLVFKGRTCSATLENSSPKACDYLSLELHQKAQLQYICLSKIPIFNYLLFDTIQLVESDTHIHHYSPILSFFSKFT